MRTPIQTDAKEIFALLDAAFAPSSYESELVRLLRERRRPIIEWVIDGPDGIAAYICYSKAYKGTEPIGYHLAPVAVRPELQGMGYGSRLISESLSLVENGEAPVFVLGDKEYYMRFGFLPISTPQCPFDPTNEHFLAIRWKESDPFTIGYEPSFADVS